MVVRRARVTVLSGMVFPVGQTAASFTRPLGPHAGKLAPSRFSPCGSTARARPLRLGTLQPSYAGRVVSHRRKRLARPAYQRLIASAAHSALLVSVRSLHVHHLQSSHHGIPALTQRRPPRRLEGRTRWGFRPHPYPGLRGADVAIGDDCGAAYSTLGMARNNSHSSKYSSADDRANWALN